MLKYEFVLRRHGFAQLLIGERPVPVRHFSALLRRELEKGERRPEYQHR